MTITEAITLTQQLYEPTYSAAILTRWLWEMDQRMLHEELLRPGIIDEYNPETDGNVTLLIPAPYERLYLLYLARMIHLHRGEYDEAANFESEWNQLRNEYMAHLLNDLPRNFGDRPWLDLPLVLRAGRKFDTDDELDASMGVLTLTLTPTYTEDLDPGGYQVRVIITTDDEEYIDAYPIPLRVLAAYPTYTSGG